MISRFGISICRDGVWGIMSIGAENSLGSEVNMRSWSEA